MNSFHVISSICIILQWHNGFCYVCVIYLRLQPGNPIKHKRVCLSQEVRNHFEDAPFCEVWDNLNLDKDNKGEGIEIHQIFKNPCIYNNTKHCTDHLWKMLEKPTYDFENNKGK